MKSIYLIALFFCFSVEANAEQKKLKVAFSEDYAPVAFVENDKSVGISPDILSEVFRSTKDLKLEFVSMPWSRAQKLVHDGLLDALVTIPSPDRLLYTTPSKTPLFVALFKVFTYKNNPQLKDMQNIRNADDLKKYVVCEYNGSGWAKSHIAGKAKKIEYSNSNQTKIKMLVGRCCDLIIDLNFIVHYNAKKLNIENEIIELPHTFDKAYYHLLINSKYPHSELMKVFEKNIHRMKKDGTIQKIISNWDHS